MNTMNVVSTECSHVACSSCTFEDCACSCHTMRPNCRHSNAHLTDASDETWECSECSLIFGFDPRMPSDTVLTSEIDENLMRENLLKCYGSQIHGFRVSTDHYRYLAEQIVSLREAGKR